MAYKIRQLEIEDQFSELVTFDALTQLIPDTTIEGVSTQAKVFRYFSSG